MYILATETKNSRYRKTVYGYLGASIACALFGVVYEVFSHEVYSFFMMGAFLIPLIFGVLPFMLFLNSKKHRDLSLASLNLYHAGIATLTIGSILTGVMEIYGTTNSWILIYGVAGGTLLGLGIILIASKCLR